jgi:hypothetical protein
LEEALSAWCFEAEDLAVSFAAMFAEEGFEALGQECRMLMVAE